MYIYNKYICNMLYDIYMLTCGQPDLLGLVASRPVLVVLHKLALARLNNLPVAAITRPGGMCSKLRGHQFVCIMIKPEEVTVRWGQK